MIDKLRTFVSRYWPLAVLVIVVISLFVFRIDRTRVDFNATDTVYCCGNNLLILEGTPSGSAGAHADVFTYTIPTWRAITRRVDSEGERVTLAVTTIPLWPYQALAAAIAVWCGAKRHFPKFVQQLKRCRCDHRIRRGLLADCPACGRMRSRVGIVLRHGWPIALIAMVIYSLHVFNIRSRGVVIHASDTYLFQANNLVWVTAPATQAGWWKFSAKFNPIPEQNVVATPRPHQRRPPPGAVTVIPLWPYQAAIVVFAIYAMIRRGIVMARRAANRCPCGYNLHGNVSGFCPECGVVVASIGNEIPATNSSGGKTDSDAT